MRLSCALATSLAASLAFADPPASPGPPLRPPGAVEPPAALVAGDLGRAGTLEVGGSFGLVIASGVVDVAFAPSVGRFVADNVELSAIASVGHVKATDQSATVWSALVEPSYHLPLGPATYGVLGMGVGTAYEHTLGTGLAIAPRIGAGFAVGRSGIVTTALVYEYITHSARDGRTEAALVAITSALRLTVGYAVPW